MDTNIWKFLTSVVCNSSVQDAFKMKLAAHLWLPFIGHPQSDVVLFENIYFGIYKYLVIEWNNRTSIMTQLHSMML